MRSGSGRPAGHFTMTRKRSGPQATTHPPLSTGTAASRQPGWSAVKDRRFSTAASSVSGRIPYNTSAQSRQRRFSPESVSTAKCSSGIPHCRDDRNASGLPV
ncbi:hypothetical protein GCM10010400_30850 [Streptomyces aculeolatus]